MSIFPRENKNHKYDIPEDKSYKSKKGKKVA